MAKESKIGWTDATLNFWLGCSKINEACANCYAEEMMDSRFSKVNWGLHTPRVLTTDKYWNQAIKWDSKSDPQSPTVVFSNSLADMWEENHAQVLNHKKEPLYIGCNGAWLPGHSEFVNASQSLKLRLTDVRRKALNRISILNKLRWVVLTKRPADIMKDWPFRYVNCVRCHGKFSYNVASESGQTNKATCPCVHDRPGSMREMIPIPHMWICVSVGTQAHYDQLMSEFRPVIEQMRPMVGGFGLSIEPQLERIFLDIPKHSEGGDYPFKWIKVGGESGPKSRPFDLAWAESLLLECDKHDDVKFFFKQTGEKPQWTVGTTTNVYSLPKDDKKGEKFENVPVTVRLRQSPFKQEVRDPACIHDEELQE